MTHSHPSDVTPPDSHHHLYYVWHRLWWNEGGMSREESRDLAQYIACVLESTLPHPLLDPAKPLHADNRLHGVSDGYQSHPAVVESDVATDRQAREFTL